MLGDQEIQYQIEQLTCENLDLLVVETAAARNQQFSSSERSTVAIIATNLMGWKANLARQAKNMIALAACSLVSYDVGFKCVIGRKSLKNWLK
jgi:hypothetical protein